jgi:hypothetical protein
MAENDVVLVLLEKSLRSEEGHSDRPLECWLVWVFYDRPYPSFALNAALELASSAAHSEI